MKTDNVLQVRLGERLVGTLVMTNQYYNQKGEKH